MKRYHIDLMFGHTPITGTITLAEDNAPRQESLLPAEPSRPKGVITEKMTNVLKYHHGEEEIRKMSFDEARRLIGQYMEEYNKKQESFDAKPIEAMAAYTNDVPLPWEEPVKKRGRPKKS